MKRGEFARKSVIGDRARTGSPIPKPCHRGDMEINETRRVIALKVNQPPNSAAKPLTRDATRRIVANIAKLLRKAALFLYRQARLAQPVPEGGASGCALP